jgi:hypothetical protein
MFPNTDVKRRFIADHFRKRRTPLTEDAILEAIKTPRSKYDVYWGVLALRDVGTARAVPVLKGLLHYPMQDVKDCSLLTIAHIAGASETDFYLSALTEKGRRLPFRLEISRAGRPRSCRMPVDHRVASTDVAPSSGGASDGAACGVTFRPRSHMSEES